tara:strand:+ start:1950 stop:2171 length:222 start_codon:yes stop_codon:yes gene_type:complete
MEEIKEVSEGNNGQEVKMVEVPLNMITNLRQILEVVNTRGFNWRTEELLPVGMIVKQVDEIISKNGGSNETTQ